MSGHHELLLGEWACLGALAERPTHGFAVAKRMAPDGDLGRVWSLSRPLTYRCLDRLVEEGLARPLRVEPGVGGGTRTVLAPTASGRRRLRAWLRRPVPHLRDLRTELLLKVELSIRLGVGLADLLEAQRVIVDDLADALARQARAAPGDPVVAWRAEMAAAARRFLVARWTEGPAPDDPVPAGG